MDEQRYKTYFYNFIIALKERAKEAKKEWDLDQSGEREDFFFTQRSMVAYHTLISFLKRQADAFSIDQKELGLADIDPDRDLIDLSKSNDSDRQ